MPNPPADKPRNPPAPGGEPTTDAQLAPEAHNESQDDEAEPGRIYDSVTRRLFTLSDEVLVFPGHDFHGRTVSTIGEERRANPFLR